MKRFHFILVLSFLTIFQLAGQINGSDWVEYERSKEGDVYSYRKVKINKTAGKHIVQLWRKKVFSARSKEEYIQTREKSGLSTEGWDKFSNEQCIFNIDCKKRTIQLLSIIQYNNDDKVLHAGSYHQPTWIHIIRDSDGDSLREKVCK